MRILITGGAGFIGSELGKYLVKKGHKVIPYDNLEYGYIDNISEVKPLRENFILGDVRSPNFYKIIKDVDVVVHLAGISALPECESNPVKAFDVNLTGTINVLNACRSSNVKRIVFASTSAVYENNLKDEPHCENEVVHPNLIYATSKYCAEQVCRSYAENYGLDIIVCRFFNVFGPHQDFKRRYPPFTSYIVKELLAARKPIIYNTSDVKRDYIYVQDLLRYLELMIESDRHYPAEVFNLATGRGYSTLQIAKEVFSLLEQKFDYEEGVPAAFWDKYSELFSLRYNLRKERVEQEVYKNCIGSNLKLVKEFEYLPKYDMEKGLAEVIAYQRSFSK